MTWAVDSLEFISTNIRYRDYYTSDRGTFLKIPKFTAVDAAIKFDQHVIEAIPISGGYDDIKFPFVMSDPSQEIHIFKRTVRKWENVPWYCNLVLNDCKLPPLSEIPNDAKFLWIEVDRNFKDSIIEMFDRLKARLTFLVGVPSAYNPRVDDSIVYTCDQEIIKICKWDDGRIWVNRENGIKGLQFKDVFELQDYLIETGFENLV